MQKNHISFLLVVAFALLFSKFAFTQSNYPEYYKVVRQAKKLEKNEKNDSALILFVNAFKLVDYIHVKNLHAAIKVAQKIKNDTLKSCFKKQLELENKNIDRYYGSAINELFKSDQSARRKSSNAQKFYFKCLIVTTCNKAQKKKFTREIKNDTFEQSGLFKY